MQPQFVKQLAIRYATEINKNDPDCKTVLDQLYRAYAESNVDDLPEIGDGVAELESFLEPLPMDDNNAVWNLCCRICIAYE